MQAGGCPWPARSWDEERRLVSRPLISVRRCASSRLPTEHAQLTPVQTCIKLNNIAAATVELDKLYFQMDVDKWASGNSALSGGQAAKTRKSLYTIKVARADLGDRFYDEQASLRARVELSDESGHQIAMTRTVPTDTAFPRCEYEIASLLQGPDMLTGTTV